MNKIEAIANSVYCKQYKGLDKIAQIAADHSFFGCCSLNRLDVSQVLDIQRNRVFQIKCRHCGWKDKFMYDNIEEAQSRHRFLESCVRP